MMVQPTEKMPHFSFRKKPIVPLQSRQRKCSHISIVHDYPRQCCDHIDHDCDHSKFYSKYRGIMKDKDELPDDAIDDLSFEYDYDEKIRAPRMSVMNVYKSHRSKDSSLTDSLNDLNTSSTSSQQIASSYQPAEFELNKQNDDETVPSFLTQPYTFRRKSAASSGASSGVSPGRSISVPPSIPKSKSTLSISKQRQYQLQKRPSLKGLATTGHLRQINEPSPLPNYVPPVLRAIDRKTLVNPEEKRKISKFKKSSSDFSLLEETLSSASTTKHSSTSLFGRDSKLEPSHACWKPNDSANYCAGCGCKFNLLRRKHHCRRCGYIFCFNCLQKRANLNLLAKFENPFASSEREELCAVISEPNTANPDPERSGLFSVKSQDALQGQSHASSVDYTKFSRVCESCYEEWVKFLETGVEYEPGYRNLEELETRKSSVVKTNVPNDWTWSSF